MPYHGQLVKVKSINHPSPTQTHELHVKKPGEAVKLRPCDGGISIPPEGERELLRGG